MPTREHTLDRLSSLIGDKYEVFQWIGGGGMADVFLARHRLHGGLFAVKVLADHLARDRSIVERFLQEARTAASLSGHPNIVPIFDVGEDQGLHYLIMQYVEGEDLAAYLARKGKLPPDEATAIVRQVAEALVWAHSKGVVHRDLKPGNVRLDRSGRVMVLDFGIAKASELPTVLTSHGERLGTPLYMSPEHIRGEVCDGRSDLYSLGIVLFELLTGRRPFTGENHRAIEHAQMHAPAPSPAEAPPAYCKVVLRLLEKDPKRRYPTAAALIEDLKALEAPVALKRRRLLGAAAVTVALVLAVFFLRTSRTPDAVKPNTEAIVEPAAIPQRIETPTGVMHLVAAGSFTFGDSSKESPNALRSMFLPGFYVDETEVSNAAYKQFCDATGQRYPEDVDYFLGKPNHPAANVTAAEAEAFARWAGKRLPSEEEWEKAARGSDGRVYPWGSATPEKQANLGGADDGFEQAAPVDVFSEGASPYGLRNMAGNVWEWTTSAYPVTQREIADMKTLLSDVGADWLVIKGGSFAPQTGELWLRTYQRRGFPATGKSPFIGFRCVKDAK